MSDILKQRALALLDELEHSDDACSSWDFGLIREALEALPEEEAWHDPDLCADIAETLERLQEINPEQYAYWYSKLYPIENSPGDEWHRCTLATLRNLIRWKGYCEASLDLSNQDDVGDAGAVTALDALYANNSEGLQRLAYEEKLELAKNPNTSQETLKVLATDEDRYVRCGVARHSNTPQETLKVLATDEYSYVRYWVAKNPNTPQETLQVLATDKDSSVRYWVAKNPNTPQESLQVLATDKDWDVRCGVARHSNTPQETLKVLATDKDSSFRYWVAQNPNTPQETLQVLATDEDSDVRCEAKNNPNYKKQML